MAREPFSFRAGFPHSWWGEAARCYCYLRNIHDSGVDGLTAYQKRFNEPFPGLKIPFGSYVDYLPTAKEEVGDRQKFAPRSRPGIFVGYAWHSGGLWTRDYLVADLQDFVNRLGRTDVHRISRIVPPANVTFPLWGRDYDQMLLDFRERMGPPPWPLRRR